MRIVAALGGNALLRRGEPMTATTQRENIRAAAGLLAPIALEHELVITHGNGPQVGLLALRAAAFARSRTQTGAHEPTPLDVLGAESEGMIGYMIEQELGNVLPFDRPLATILTMVEVDPEDPAFDNPTKRIGPIYPEAEARRLAEERGWKIGPDGPHWRRVVPSPIPRRVFEIRPIKWLLDHGTVVICAGGGGIPTMYDSEGMLVGAQVVIDKDRASALLARELEADLLILATDVEGVFEDWGSPDERKLESATPVELEALGLGNSAMGSKVEAACDFTRLTGNRSAIGALHELDKLVAGSSGTQVRT